MKNRAESTFTHHYPDNISCLDLFLQRYKIYLLIIGKSFLIDVSYTNNIKNLAILNWITVCISTTHEALWLSEITWVSEIRKAFLKNTRCGKSFQSIRLHSLSKCFNEVHGVKRPFSYRSHLLRHRTNNFYSLNRDRFSRIMFYFKCKNQLKVN